MAPKKLMVPTFSTLKFRSQTSPSPKPLPCLPGEAVAPSSKFPMMGKQFQWCKNPKNCVCKRPGIQVKHQTWGFNSHGWFIQPRKLFNGFPQVNLITSMRSRSNQHHCILCNSQRVWIQPTIFNGFLRRCLLHPIHEHVCNQNGHCK